MYQYGNQKHYDACIILFHDDIEHLQDCGENESCFRQLTKNKILPTYKKKQNRLGPDFG